jgi:hypothetical protein
VLCWKLGREFVVFQHSSALLDSGGTRCTFSQSHINPLTPNDYYSGRTAPLTSKPFILYIYSTYIGTAYFKHGIYSSFLSLQNAVCFIILTYLVPVLFTFYIQSVLKLQKNSGAKRLMAISTPAHIHTLQHTRTVHFSKHCLAHLARLYQYERALHGNL